MTVKRYPGSLRSIVILFWAAVLCLLLAALVDYPIIGILVAVGLFLLLARAVWLQYIAPVHFIREWTEKIRAGNLDATITAPCCGEFQNVVRELNFVGEMLQSQSHDNDSQLQRHTDYIAKKTQSLSLLYDVATSINMSRDIDSLLNQYLHTITEMINAGAAATYVVQDLNRVRLVSHIGLNESILESHPTLPIQLAPGRNQSNIEVTQVSCPATIKEQYFRNLDVKVLVIPLQYRGQMLGAYNFYIGSDEGLIDNDIKEVCLAIGRHLGTAIAKERLDQEATTVSIMQERTHIANELHDSLAQTLTSIRFQVRVLDETLHRGDDAQAWQELERIEASISEAHTEIRELIAYFRAPALGGSLADSVEQIVERFRQTNDDIYVFFQNEWPEQQLPPEIEYQVARIIQESLTNIRKHSEANTVRILMRGDDQGHYRVLIEDDGIGFEQTRPSGHRGEHIGLSIMKDRARRIGGTVQIESEPGEGVQVTLEFTYAQPH